MASPSRNNVVAVVVTYRRAAELAQSLQIVAAQTVAPNHLVVVDNDNDPAIKTLVEGQPIATTYLGSNRNLGGAGGFALGMLHALTLGADWVWLADDDGPPGRYRRFGETAGLRPHTSPGGSVAHGVRYR
ncbi:glycosyl transferase 2 family protein [Mycobacteroides abscessus 1948]|uniref:Glycosyl transferase 2 family protein n=1 Tax=Mycobacteroides abscessus 1948 TaxID=1299323 RepID=A0A829QP26_9MYCO|nr:glycosyl transferase 2 family protein [Mycobacteroides abscessus 1948]